MAYHDLCWAGGTNPWYLSQDGEWRYDRRTAFATAEDAYWCLWRSLSIEQLSQALDSKDADGDGCEWEWSAE